MSALLLKFFFKSWLKNHFVEGWLIYSVMLISATQQSDSTIHLSICLYIHTYSFSYSFPLEVTLRF